MATAMILAKRDAVSSFVVDKLRLSHLRSVAAAVLSRSFASSTDVPNPSEERGVDVVRRPDTAPVQRRRQVGDLFPAFFGGK
ncbi:hypothetical protein OPV22_006026 [Ensete ventricosum]|uniref:Uncharacterized protein n=1 Tax=Ensete ventricosum TaxID=4639 RepID=A0AAV8RSL7_ENSVE|nr:hypothetical protein OPV22_006026 [Ensete ventricosum]